MSYNDSPVFAENLAQFLWDHRTDDIIATVPMTLRYVGTGSSIPNYEVHIYRVLWMRRLDLEKLPPEQVEAAKKLTDFLFRGHTFEEARNPQYRGKDNYQRFEGGTRDGELKPFLDPHKYDELRDDDKFLYNRGPRPIGLEDD